MADTPLILVDGSSYLFRAYHALPDLTNSEGLPTGAIHGVTNMLRKLLDEYQPSHIAVIFDARGPSFRNELYPEYKANRPPMPEELAVQIEPTHALIRLMGLPLIVAPGVEADDVIGTLAKQAVEQGMDVLISTGDKDMAQLVNDHVTLINTMDNRLTDIDGVFERFAVWPEQIIDYLALMGDKVDNIPGVPKCGPKTAAKWLAEYGDLDAVMANADAIKGKIGENLRASLDFLPLSRELATIKLDVPLEQEPRDLIVTEPDTEALRDKLNALGFRSWIRQLDGDHADDRQTPTSAEPARNYTTILDMDSLNTWIERLREAPLFAFDTETTSLNALDARVVGLSFAIEGENGIEAAYVPLAHDYLGAPAQLDREEALAALRPILEDAEQPKVMQNLKYDTGVLQNHGIELRGVDFDTMLESYVFNSSAGRHDMDSLARRYLDRETIHFEDIAGKGKNQLGFSQITIEQAAPYAAEDAEITLGLHQALWPQLSADTRLKRIFTDIEMPLASVLGRMERTGVLVDSAMLQTQSRELAERMMAAERVAHDAVGHPFNLNSPKQIQQIFYEELDEDVPVLKKTPKGAPSTSEEVLEQLAEREDIKIAPKVARAILDYRGLAKLKSTYTDALPQCIHPHSGRVHTSYHQAVAATGRLSSKDPNLQNIPVRNADGRRIRQAFIPAPGKLMVAADYSQIELRIMAHLSGDRGLLDAFAANEDIHRATAAEVFDTAPEAVSPEQRRSAKAINFGLIYGMSAFGLARQLGIDRGEAQRYVDLYFARYPGVKDYMERTREQAHEQGYVETLFGRRLYLPNIKARNPQIRQGAERAAINAPMQGTAADIIKRAMIELDRWLENDQPEVTMTMQVHDELVFEVPKPLVDELIPPIRAKMENAAELKVALIVDVGIGENWDQAH